MSSIEERVAALREWLFEQDHDWLVHRILPIIEDAERSIARGVPVLDSTVRRIDDLIEQNGIEVE
jgi:hypothetical protein